MTDLKQELESVRADMKKRPIDQHKYEIIELVEKHGASQREVVAWLLTCRSVDVSQSTLSRLLAKWNEKK
ncbi:MAG: hypothetical protein COB83_05090 [Gammaproteobacteria bacterium]|nr:MAG: hypothetical protein COB83_05090 [Gammaproteobacteria bacterium]